MRAKKFHFENSCFGKEKKSNIKLSILFFKGSSRNNTETPRI